MKITTQLENDSVELEISALKERLSMSYEERIDAHEFARQLLEDLKIAGETLDAKSKRTP